MKATVANAKQYRKALQKALDTVEVEGITFKQGNISVDPIAGTFSMKLVATVETEAGGKAEEQHVRDWKQYADMWFGGSISDCILQVSDLGRAFRHKGVIYKIAGLKTRARKRPVLCEDLQGNRTVWPREAFKEGVEWVQ
jgi:hypothetical protein